MKVVGIIAEYNPFHKGHEYQIRYAREVLGADHVVVAMSGDFVQRGAPALMEKHLRAEMALLRRRSALQYSIPRMLLGEERMSSICSDEAPNVLCTEGAFS